MSSPRPGAETRAVTSAMRIISISDWPTPTVSMITGSQPLAAMIRATAPAEAHRPPRRPRVAMDRMTTSSSRACCIIRTRSPWMAPPVMGEEGSTPITPIRLFWPRQCAMSLSVRVDLPAPGAPVMPATMAFSMEAPSREARSCSASGAPSSTRDMALAMARLLRSPIPVMIDSMSMALAFRLRVIAT